VTFGYHICIEVLKQGDNIFLVEVLKLFLLHIYVYIDFGDVSKVIMVIWGQWCIWGFHLTMSWHSKTTMCSPWFATELNELESLLLELQGIF